MPERASFEDPIWRRRWRLLPTKALAYLRRRYSFAARHVPGTRVLDLACGEGLELGRLARAQWLVALDWDPAAVQKALMHGRAARAVGVIGDMRKLPFRPATFETVLLLEALEHIARHDAKATIDETVRVLPQGGLLVLSTPLLIGTRHSSNPHHLYEWREEELVEVIGSGYSLAHVRRIQGPAGPAILIAAKRRASPALAAAPASDQAIRLRHSVACLTAWLAAHHRGSWVRYAEIQPEQPQDPFLPLCFAVMARECVGSLEALQNDERRDISAAILEAQDPETGLFHASCVQAADLEAPRTCDLGYVKWQLTYFGLSAACALGVQPRHRLHFLDAFYDRSFVLGWVDGGPWHDPWNHSNRIMFLLRFLIYSAEAGHQPAALEIVDTVLNDLDVRQDPITGLWHGLGSTELTNGVYAAYHFLPFYFWRRRQPNYLDRIVDSTLSIQSVDGSFSGGNVGVAGACEDLDAVDVLVKASLASPYREADIRYALQRTFDRLLQLQSLSGGFPNYHGSPPPTKSVRRRLGEALALDVLLDRPYRPPQPVTLYSGWRRVAAIRGAADMWGAWFRSLALHLIVSRYPALGSFPPGAKFHRLPCLGWHDPAAIIASNPSDSHG